MNNPLVLGTQSSGPSSSLGSLTKWALRIESENTQTCIELNPRKRAGCHWLQFAQGRILFTVVKQPRELWSSSMYPTSFEMRTWQFRGKTRGLIKALPRLCMKKHGPARLHSRQSQAACMLQRCFSTIQEHALFNPCYALAASL